MIKIKYQLTKDVRETYWIYIERVGFHGWKPISKRSAWEIEDSHRLVKRENGVNYYEKRSS